jgi:hypothetical protein
MDESKDVQFNGVEFSLKRARGVIRFIHNKACLDSHELLLLSEGHGGELTNDELRLIKVVCRTLDCSAFEHSGRRIV